MLKALLPRAVMAGAPNGQSPFEHESLLTARSYDNWSIGVLGYVCKRKAAQPCLQWAFTGRVEQTEADSLRSYLLGPDQTDAAALGQRSLRRCMRSTLVSP